MVDKELLNNASKQSFMQHQLSIQKQHQRMSMPKIKQVFVSPKLNMGGTSLRRLVNLQS